MLFIFLGTDDAATCDIMLSKDRATLRNVLLTVAVTTSAALIAGTVWLGSHRNDPAATATATSVDDTRLSGASSAAPTQPANTTTITSTTYNVTVQPPGATGATAAMPDTARQEATGGSAPAAVQVRGNPVAVAPATAAAVQQEAPLAQAEAAPASPPQAPPIIIPVQTGSYVNPATGMPVRTNDTVSAVPIPSAITPGANQVQQGGPPPVGVPQTTATTQPVAPPATGTPPPAPTGAVPQTGLGTGFSQTTPAAR